MFRRPEVRYGHTPEPDTPYRRARQQWDDRVGQVAVTGRRVWLLGLFQSTAIVALAGGLVWQGARGKVTPWVVEVDKLGEVRTVGPAETDFRPTDAMVAARLQRFIEEVRSVSSDPIVVRQNWLRAYDFTNAEGARALDAYAQANDPFQQVGKVQVSVEVSSVIRATPDSFRVAWIERRYQDGALVVTERWTAILTLAKRRARTPEQLRKNPLGLYVKAIHEIQDKAGVALKQPPQEALEPSRPNRADHADPQHALLAPGLVRHALDGLIERGDGALGAGHEVMAGLGQANARRATFEDGRSETLLELADPARDGRLLDAEAARRPPKSAMFGRRQDVA